jgi:hypothetical protein
MVSFFFMVSPVMELACRGETHDGAIYSDRSTRDIFVA